MAHLASSDFIAILPVYYSHSKRDALTMLNWRATQPRFPFLPGTRFVAPLDFALNGVHGVIYDEFDELSALQFEVTPQSESFL
jgi:hypothetical protein